MKLEITLTDNGIKNSLSVEFCRETWPQLIEAGSLSPAIVDTEADLLETVILPSLTEAVQQLVSANQLFSANLVKYCIET